MGAHDVSRRLLAVLAVLTLAAGCTSSASLTPTPTSTPAPTPSASQPAALRCAETPDAVPSATVQWDEVMGAEPTIKAGQAVAFVTTGYSPTVTEWGTNGKPAESPCIDKTIGQDVGPMKVVVTFYLPGDYNITCRKIPLVMHTVVHVQ